MGMGGCVGVVSFLLLFYFNLILNFSLFLRLLFKCPKLVSVLVIYPARRNDAIISDMKRANLRSQLNSSTK